MPSAQSDHIEPTAQFEKRKQDHIRLSLEDKNEALGGSGLDQVRLIHEALPELNFSEVQLQHLSLGLELQTPFLVSSMTAGHYGSLNLNRILAEACERRGWMMGVGSQRRELGDPEASQEWRDIRKSAPRVRLLGNLGLSQLIHTPTTQVQKLVDALEASAMIIHTNPLQECVQPEGTPNFRGGLDAIRRLTNELSIPVVLKETGCGFSSATLRRLRDSGVAAIDISGYGGTHWGRIEGDRAGEGDFRAQVAHTFRHWGISTVESLMAGLALNPPFEVWASGGVRSGLDAASLLAMGARLVGFAKPILEAALMGEDALDEKMNLMEYELKSALFCTGCATVAEMQSKRVWTWHK